MERIDSMASQTTPD